MKIKKDSKKPENTYSIPSNYRFIISSMWNYDKSLLPYGLIEIILSVLTPLSTILLPAVVISLLTSGEDLPTLAKKMVGLFLLYGLLISITSYFKNRNSMQYISFRLRGLWSSLLEKCIGMDYATYESQDVQKSFNKASDCIYSNYFGIEAFISENILLITNLLGLILYALIISSAHPLIIVLLITISLIQFLTYRFATKYELKNKDEKSKLRISQEYIKKKAFDSAAGKDIRIYQINKWIGEKYLAVNHNLQRLITKERGLFFVYDLVGVILAFIRDAVSYGYLFYLLKNGLPISYFVLYLGVITGFSVWFTKIFENIAKISRFHYSICDFRNFFATKDIFNHHSGKELNTSDETFEIVFDHVTFQYPGTTKKVLDDISFQLRKGEKLALVGINGAGKSTIVKLMCGLYKPTSGTVTVNGINIEELNVEKYFGQIAAVFQESFTYSFTIAENVSGKSIEETNYEKCKEALQKSGLWNKIESLPNNIETYLNKDIEMDGIQLSGGEYQKLMLARAIYKDAKFLILDEPTAALDAIAESEMYIKYSELVNNKTALFISHRLASTRFCDRILFLENGKIVEEGSHDSLMKQNGQYANMFHVQSQYYKEGGDLIEY